MNDVNFLNIEYLILHLYRILETINSFLAGNFVGDGSASQIVSKISFTFGQIALLGMAVSVILLALAVYTRIRLEIVEHTGLHGHDAHGDHGEHGANANVGSQAEHTGHGAPSAPAMKERWEKVMELSSSVNESEWRRAIIEADIMLGEVLESLGYQGKTIGEQLKDANPIQFRSLNAAWQAHKVRNEIAHAGEGFHLAHHAVREAIDNYKRVFEEAGVI